VSFIFGGETGLTYEEVQQQRERARELARLLGGTPRNVGEGLNYLGMAIASRMAQNRANRGEATIRQRGNDAFGAITSALTGGGSTGGERVFTSGSTGGVGAQGDSAAVAGIALDSEAPTAGLRHMLPSTDPDLNDPRRSQFATAAPRVDDPNVFTTDVVGNTAGVNPELLRNLGNSAEQAFGPGGVVTVSSGHRHGPAGGSDHNSGEAADFNMAPFGQEAPISTDPRYFDMARVAAADPYPVRAVGIGDDYMGHAYNHFGTGEGQGIPTARAWSDWNTGAELARSGRNSADVGGAGDPNYQFAAEIQNILNTDRIPLGGGSEGTMVAQAPQVETTASTRTPATGGIASQVRGGLVDRFTGQLGVDPQQAEMLADAFLLNMEDESGLVPDMIERVPNVHGTRGRGLYQLTGSRRDAYERLYGDDYSIDNQLDFLVSELQGPESRAWNAISGAGNTGEAAAAIVTDFLRPAAQHRDRRVAEYLGGRMPSLETTASASNPADAPSSDIGAATVAALEATSPAPQPRQGGAPMQPRQQNPIVQALMSIQPNNVLMGDVGSMPGGPQSPVVLDREGNAMPNPMLRPDARRGMAAGGVTGAVQQAAQSGGGIGGVIQSLLGGGQQQPRQAAPQPAPMPAQGGVAPAQPPAGGGMPAPVAPPQVGAAPAPAPPPAQSGQPDLANIPLSALMEAAGNPMLTDAQRSVAQMLLEQRLQQPDPMDAIELERAQLELDQLRNPQEDQTSLMQNYNFLIEQGFTPEEALDRLNAGPTINNNITGDAAPAVDATLRDELQKNRADVLTGFTEAAAAAASVRNDLQALRELSALAPSGPLEGRFAQMFPEFNDVAAARNAIVRRVAPTLRAEGSGSTSDIEYAGMVAGLGELPNSPAVNVAIADMMLAKADLDLQRGTIVSQYEAGRLPYEDMVNQLEELNQVSIMPDSLRAILDGASGAGASAPSDFTSMTPQELIAVDTSNFTPQQWIDYDAALAAAMEAAQ
jgi:hypothetical protein